MTNIDFSYRHDSRGRTATTDDSDHIRDLIHQLLFTTPGERVMRPSLGSGLLQLTFAPNSQELGAATQMLVQSALQEWLGDLILVNNVTVQAEDSSLQVRIDYIVRQTQEQRVDEFDSRDGV